MDDMDAVDENGFSRPKNLRGGSWRFWLDGAGRRNRRLFRRPVAGEFRGGPPLVFLLRDAVGNADAQLSPHVFLEWHPLVVVLNSLGPGAHGDEGMQFANPNGAKCDSAQE